MTRLLLLLCFLLTIPLHPVFAQENGDDLVGTWVMVSQKVVYPDSVVNRGETLPRTIKVLNQTHFAFGRQISGAEEVLAGGGRYSYDGKTYTEHVEFHTASSLVGLSLPFAARVENDVWYHTGELPEFRIEEVWRRVEPGEGL